MSFSPVPRSRRLWTWVPVVLWAGVIFALSAMPDLGNDARTWEFALRKIGHFCEYAVLGLLLARAAGDATIAAAAGVAYAGSDELHQHFVPGRHATIRDVAIDAAGVLAGLAVAHTRRWS